MNGATRFLFVSNGHGEAAIAERIAREIHALDERALLEHVPLVGLGAPSPVLVTVGPRAAMPSGGLVAMGNVGAFARDVRAGFGKLFAAQVAFLRGAHAHYDVALAVGDAYALALTLLARLPTFFVGTAKSAYVAPYGFVERAILRRARRVFVRDERTALDLLRSGVRGASAPGNVIVDLLEHGATPPSGPWLGILPGSRATAYADAVRLARVVRALGERKAERARALLSIAPGLEAHTFAAHLRDDGWSVEPAPDPTPLRATSGAALIMGWTGGLGPLLQASLLVLGQAGTANEAAAACGLPVVALAGGTGRAAGWYRMRQQRLLGEALALIPADPEPGAEALAALLDDPAKLQTMRAAGPLRMGGPGGARAIAEAVVAFAGGRAA